MKNIRINEAESIFEVLWNHGEPGTQKYCSLVEWRISTGEMAKRIANDVSAVQFEMRPGKEGCAWPFTMERDCDLDISRYDRIIMKATLSPKIKFRMTCRIDGQDVEILTSVGTGMMKEYEGLIEGGHISLLRLEYENMSQSDEVIRLNWFGLANTAKRKEMLSEPCQYTPDWPGCFAEEPVLTPQIGLYFDADGLVQLREKLKKPGFKEGLDYIRRAANRAMHIVPETEVGDYVYYCRHARRTRDYDRPNLVEAMENLAFVGLIDENMEMLRLACRMALAVCHCKFFHDNPLTGFPGATWHQRSFNEKFTSKAVIKVLDWAGGLLSWHGQDIIFDALMMKGLPRMDSDIKVLDDIWYTNQGLAFVSGLIGVLITLSKRYPRYKVRVEEAEKDFMTMWEYYCQEDGGIFEGGGYWNYSMSCVMEAMLLLSTYYGKSLKEYVPDRIKRTADYTHAIASTIGPKNAYIPYNDAFPGGALGYASFMAQLGAGKYWESEATRQTRSGVNTILGLMAYQYHDMEEDVPHPDFCNLPITGVTSVRMDTQDMGKVALFAISGRSFPGHGHADKGSFIVEADKRAILIDRGTCNYEHSYSSMVHKSEVHNMITAVKDGVHLGQQQELFDITEDMHGGKYSGYVLKAEYENGKFAYATDITDAWKGIFRKNVRYITADEPHEIKIRDSLEIDTQYEVCFILNCYGEITKDGNDYLITDGDIRVRVHLENWEATREEFGPCGIDGKVRPVNRLCIFTGGKQEYDLQTTITLKKQ